MGGTTRRLRLDDLARAVGAALQARLLHPAHGTDVCRCRRLWAAPRTEVVRRGASLLHMARRGAAGVVCDANKQQWRIE